MWMDNIGIVKQSEIELNGLTVITGYNNSGKTTVGKVLFSLISAVEDLQKNALNDKKNFVKDRIGDMIEELKWWYFSENRERKENKEIDEISELSNILPDIDNVVKLEDLKCGLQQMIEHIAYLEELILKRTRSTEKTDDIKLRIDSCKKLINSINKVIQQDEDLAEYANTKINNTLNQEFNHQILPVGFEELTGTIRLTNESKSIFNVIIKNNEIAFQKDTYTPLLGKEAVFIDNVFILDELTEKTKKQERMSIQQVRFCSINKKEFLSFIQGKGHNSKLTKELMHKDENLFREILNKKKANEIFDRLNTVFDDELTFENGEVICAKSKIDIRNLAMGAKMFAMLKTLLENGSINENTVLILDEPEVHLHPEWQNILAELLVLLQYQMGVTVLFTTHSSQFLMAVETFAKKYELGEKFKVYATTKNSQDKFVTYTDVTNSLNDAYYRLAKPMFDMKSVKDELEK